MMISVVLAMLQAPVVIPPSSALAASSTNAPARSVAAGFADLYLPDATARAEQRDGIRRLLQQGFDADPRTIVAERARPGMRAAWVAGGLARLDRLQDERLPAHRRQVADALQAAFTPAEIGEITAFYASDAGRAMVTEIFAQFDPVMPGSGPSSREQLRRQIDARGLERSLDPAIRVRVAAFGATSIGRKFNRWSPRLTRLLLATTDETWVVDNAEIQAAADMAMHRFMAATPIRDSAR